MDEVLKETFYLFNKLIASLTQLKDEVLKETFFKGLNLMVRAELDVLELDELAQMMRLARKIEDQKLVRLVEEGKS